MSDAMKLAAPPVPMDVDELGQHLAEVHANEPQREMMARRALAMVREGLGHLAALGHQFMLVRHQPGPPLEFPRMLYKQGPGGESQMTVESQDEMDKALADGWVKSPQDMTEAQVEVPSREQQLDDNPPPPPPADNSSLDNKTPWMDHPPGEAQNDGAN